MKRAYVFPGQGSQQVGMGGEYFDQFPQLVQMVDSVLGYSIKELCLEDPNKCLSQTRFTQPALYTVNALAYIAKTEDGLKKPDIVAGHSLGEFNALLAAGAYDFETGLKLVQKRGELMSLANQGGMLAVLGVDIGVIRNQLQHLNKPDVQIANINSPQQTILSGNIQMLQECATHFEALGAKCVPLNVSAAFHSTFMREARESFQAYLRGFQFRPLDIPVIANLTGLPYPTANYQHILADQITGTVKWNDSVLWLLQHGVDEIEEVGPGMVLTKLTNIIKKSVEEPVTPTANVSSENSRRFLFMYGGQGFHYRNMGRELYEKSQVFRTAMDECDAVVRGLSDVSIVADLYQKNSADVDVENILLTHPACFAFGYALTCELEARGVMPGAVLGYSLGEYIAATIAGVVNLNDALQLVCAQATLLKARAVNGRMLAVLTDAADFSRNSADYAGASLACVNYRDNFIVSGAHPSMVEVQKRLEKRGVLTAMLPVAHSFHSHDIDPIAEEFSKVVERMVFAQPTISCYSSSHYSPAEKFQKENLWRAVRAPVNFHGVISEIKNNNNYVFIDLSPTASLAAFMDRCFGKNAGHQFAVNQFGKNLETLDKMVAEVASIP
jgi:malonyl CoA-acyl carrier protein transacylase